MPALTNSRHEAFARALVEGKTADEAYVLAGYKKNSGNAATLKGNQSVLCRVQELRDQVAERTLVTVEGITDRLMAIADKAEDLKDASGFAVARGAMMDVAKLNGLIVERSENMNINHVVSDQPLSPADWEREHAETHH